MSDSARVIFTAEIALFNNAMPWLVSAVPLLKFDNLTISAETFATHRAVLRLKVVEIKLNIMTFTRDFFKLRLCTVESVTKYAADMCEEGSREEIHAEREQEKRNS